MCLIFLFSVTLQVNASTDCGQHISKILCEVGPTKTMPERFTANRPCLNKPIGKYRKIIKNAFEKFPPFLQKRFCSLEKIYVEDEFFGAAWSAPVDEKNPVSFLIGLRKKELDLNRSLAEGLAQFDSETFGPSTKIVSYSAVPSNRLTSSEFTLIHELGHTFDYEHNYNRTAKDPEFSKSWTAIAWLDIQEIQPNIDFQFRKSICLNNCNEKFVPTTEAMSLYSGMYAHGFLSQLSSTNAMEDFADSFAFFVADEILKIKIETAVNGHKFSLRQLQTAQAFVKKRDFLRNAFKEVPSEKTP